MEYINLHVLLLVQSSGPLEIFHFLGCFPLLGLSDPNHSTVRFKAKINENPEKSACSSTNHTHTLQACGFPHKKYANQTAQPLQTVAFDELCADINFDPSLAGGLGVRGRPVLTFCLKLKTER